MGLSHALRPPTGHARWVKRAAFVRDIPTHPLGRELYEHVRNNTAVFDLLREVTLDGLFYRDLTHPEHEWSDDRLWQLLGYSDADGGRYSSRQALLFPEDRLRAHAELQRCNADPERTYDCVLRYQHRDRSTVWVRCRGLVLRDAQGQPVRLLGTHVDFSELQRTREELQRVNRELELRVNDRTRELGETLTRMAESELTHQRTRTRELRQLIEGLPLLVWTTQPDGACDYLSPQWVAYTGIPESEQLGSGWLHQIHPEDRQRVTLAWQSALASVQPFDTEYRIRRHDGVYRWFQTRAVPLPAPEGVSAKWLGSSSDIHERKHLEETLRQRTAALERSNADLEEFAYLASHDLQEPLRTVASYVQLLERQYGSKLDARAHEYIAYAAAGARRMRRLVTDLLDYSRAVATPGELQEADGTAALDNALQSVAALVSETRARVVRAALPRLAIDEASLTRVLQNLLSNALNYRAEVVPQIVVSCQIDGPSAVIAVADNGIGIAPQHQRRIFQMFQRLHSSHDRPGTGVGLALCKRLIERADGQIWLESEVGRGTTFYVRLPLLAATREVRT